MTDDLFFSIRNTYKLCRMEQRSLIVRALGMAQFECKQGAFSGHGRSDYTNGGSIAPYDLSNWLWIDAFKEYLRPDGQTVKVYHFISLQAYDRDSRSGNYHILYDRLGIYSSIDDLDARGAFAHMINSNIDLPMNNDKLQQLVALLDRAGEQLATRGEIG